MEICIKPKYIRYIIYLLIIVIYLKIITNDVIVCYLKNVLYTFYKDNI